MALPRSLSVPSVSDKINEVTLSVNSASVVQQAFISTLLSFVGSFLNVGCCAKHGCLDMIPLSYQ